MNVYKISFLVFFGFFLLGALNAQSTSPKGPNRLCRPMNSSLKMEKAYSMIYYQIKINYPVSTNVSLKKKPEEQLRNLARRGLYYSKMALEEKKQFLRDARTILSLQNKNSPAFAANPFSREGKIKDHLIETSQRELKRLIRFEEVLGERIVPLKRPEQLNEK